MKKILFTILAAAVTLFAASCNKEAGKTDADGIVEARFNLGFTGAKTKAPGDGLSATQLVVGVYDKELGYLDNLSIGPNAADHKEAFSQHTAEYTVRLVKGHGYDIVFLAVCPDNGVYTIDLEKTTLTAAVSGPSNQEVRDAFYAVYSIDRVTEAIDQAITLKRPFAQINVITNKDDFEAATIAQVTFEKSSLKISAPSVLNLIDGSVGDAAEYDLSPEAMTETNPNFAPYDTQGDFWLLLDYILAAPEGSNANVEFSLYANGNEEALFTHSIPNVPLKQNWRTNIVGDILTVDGNFIITIEPAFDGEEVVDF